MAESFELKFERFASRSLQNHAQVLGVLAEHGDQLKDVRDNLAKHLNDHLQDLQKSLDAERDRAGKSTALWIGTIIGVCGVIVAVLSVVLK